MIRALAIASVAVAVACRAGSLGAEESRGEFSPAGAAAPMPRSIEDVLLSSRGVLQGRVSWAPVAGQGERPPCPRIRLLQGDQTRGETIADRQGRFAFPHLPGGLYCLVVEGADTSGRQYCRVWETSIAPPHAVAQPHVLVRGQIPIGRGLLSVVDWQKAATTSAIVSGAIAAPIIYHNAKLDNQPPSSP